MSISYSGWLTEFLQHHGSLRQAMENGKLDIWSGAIPANADAARTGTKLVRCTSGSGAITEEVAATAIVTLTGGASGSVDTLTIGGIEVMGAAVNYDTSLTVTAAAVAAQINKFSALCPLKVRATSAAEVITIHALQGMGTKMNNLAMTCGSTTITNTINGASDDHFGEGAGGSTAGVDPVNGIAFGALTGDGVLTKSSVISGVNLATGVAGYWTWEGSFADDEAALEATDYIVRIQGTCGTPGSGADMIMASTTLTVGNTHTVDTGAITLPE